MGKWTKEQVMTLAQQCSARTEFYRHHTGAYHAARVHGWMEDACAHMPTRVASRPRKWTDEAIRETVAKYSDFKSFREGQSSLFVLLWQTDRLDAFTGHLTRASRPNGYWTKERCAEAAEQCVTRIDFAKRFPAAADAAYRYGWMDDICGHMEVANAAMLRAVYVIKGVGRRTVYVGLSGNPKRRYRGHLVQPMPHTKELLSGPHRFRVVAGHRPVSEAMELERRLIAHFQRKGWDVLNVLDGGEVGGNPRKWTRKALQELAASCATRGDMMRDHSGAYCAACDKGVLDAIFADHPNRGFGDGPIRDWTPERLQEVADQCSSIKDMKKRFPKAASAAYRRGVVADLFSNRENGGYAGRGPAWTFETVKSAAAPHATRAEFRSKNYRAFRAAVRRGWLDEIFKGRPNNGRTRPAKVASREGI